MQSWAPWNMSRTRKLKLFLSLVIAYIFAQGLYSLLYLASEFNNLGSNDIAVTLFAVSVNFLVGVFFCWTLRQKNPSFYLLNAGICMLPVFAELFFFVMAHRRIEGYQTEELAPYFASSENVDYLAMAFAFLRLVLKIVPSVAFYLLYMEEYNHPILPQLLRGED